MAFKSEGEQRGSLEEDNAKLQDKYLKTMDELKETFKFLESMNVEFQTVQQDTEEIKNAEELYTHIYKIVQKENVK